MELRKIKELANLLITESTNYSRTQYLSNYPVYKSKINNILNLFMASLPEHHVYGKGVYDNINALVSYIQISEVPDILIHIINIIDIEEKAIKASDEFRFFDSAIDKYKQAGLSFKDGDYPSVFNSLNSALELILKDKIGIPSTITKINTAKIIDILIKNKIEPYVHLSEANNKILQIDNKVKHQGYIPSKIDAINGMKIMEEILSILKDINIALWIIGKIYRSNRAHF